jgi:hypothetical protein
MKFTTEIAVSPSSHQIRVADKILLVGSCFAHEMGQWFIQRRFEVHLNPNGILSHPMVIARCLQRAMEGRSYDESEFVSHNDLHHSFDFHGAFSTTSANRLMKRTNEVLGETMNSLQEASTLILTWGSAWGYKWNESGQWVSNCHKIPQSNFTKELISSSDIVAEYRLLFQELRAVNPNLQIIISVSPVRYWRDGAHGNQLSKAHLMLAADLLAAEHDFVHYFPAYEVMIDELRDYRFYAADMLHPSPQAVEYIIEKFQAMFFSDEVRHYVKQVDPLWKFLAHRPLHLSDAEWENLCRAKEQELLQIRDTFK